MKVVFVFVFVGFLSCVTSLPSSKRRYLKNSFQYLLNDFEEDAKCTLCKSVVGLLHGIGYAKEGEQLLVNVTNMICNKFKLATKRICQSIIPEFKNLVWDVFFDAIVEPNELCGWLLGPSCAESTAYFSSWNVTIPDRTHNPEIPDVRNEGSIIKILQLTDTHLDLDYLEGTKVDCGEPLCCRKEDPFASPGELAAPKYGYPGYCDTNKLFIHAMLQNISQEHKDIDYVYWTGDLPAHNVWNQSKIDQVNSIKYATQLLHQYFPGKTIFPCLGNHEGFPVNNFPPPFLTGEESGQWLRDALAEEWGTWLPGATKDTIKKGGFYTVLVKKGFRIISLNMNYGNPGNWWLWINSTDPAQQLQWFVDVLLQAEKDGEKVHVIGHMPPDHMLQWFSFNYYRIINRFYDTITGQFFGHTHHDEFRVFYDMKTFKKPISMAYISPSVTTYSNLNPGYRIYTVDGGEANSTWFVTDFDTYFVDLLKSNQTGKLDFQLEYSAKEKYNMKNLMPADWEFLLLETFIQDDNLFQYFYKAYYKQHPPMKLCTGACKKDYICTMRTALSGGFHNFCNFESPQHYKTYMLWRRETYNKC